MERLLSPAGAAPCVRPAISRSRAVAGRLRLLQEGQRLLQVLRRRRCSRGRRGPASNRLSQGCWRLANWYPSFQYYITLFPGEVP